MKERVAGKTFNWQQRAAILLAALLTMSVVWATAASAQEDPFGSQYSPPPTAPPSASCGEGSSGSSSGTGAAGDSGCAAASDTGTPDSGLAGEGEAGEVLADTSEGPVVDLLPTTGGIPLAAAALLGGSAIVVGSGIVAARNRR
ncbi:MAG: hypothetical protein ACR2KW_04735 [Rubrobacter sp.]